MRSPTGEKSSLRQLPASRSPRKNLRLLSGGIPRGHKNLTKATADLVKAGWITKGRSGWEITEDGLKATVAFTRLKPWSMPSQRHPDPG